MADNRYRLNVDITQASGVRGRSGEYLWTVLLVQVSPKYVELGIQAEPERFRFEVPGAGGGGSSGGSSSGGGIY